MSQWEWETVNKNLPKQVEIEISLNNRNKKSWYKNPEKGLLFVVTDDVVDFCLDVVAAAVVFSVVACCDFVFLFSLFITIYVYPCSYFLFVFLV